MSENVSMTRQHVSQAVINIVSPFRALRVFSLVVTPANACFVIFRMIAKIVGRDQHMVSNVCTTSVLVHPHRHSLSSSSVVVSFSANCSILAMYALATLSFFSIDFRLSGPIDSLFRLSPAALVANPLHSLPTPCTLLACGLATSRIFRQCPCHTSTRCDP